MGDYSVQVTYRVGRSQDTRGYTVSARSEADAKAKGCRTHELHAEPSTTVVRVTAEPL